MSKIEVLMPLMIKIISWLNSFFNVSLQAQLFGDQSEVALEPEGTILLVVCFLSMSEINQKLYFQKMERQAVLLELQCRIFGSPLEPCERNTETTFHGCISVINRAADREVVFLYLLFLESPNTDIWLCDLLLITHHYIQSNS